MKLTVAQLREMLEDQLIGELLGEDMGDFRMPSMKAAKATPPPLPPHARGSTPQGLRKGSAPGERLRQFKSAVNMVVTTANKAAEAGVKDALPMLDRIIHFANQAKEAVK
jgi:hypothetical protein